MDWRGCSEISVLLQPHDGAAIGIVGALHQPCWAVLPPQSRFGRTAPRSRRQVALGRHQVGQSQQHHQPLRVLGQPTVADLGVAEAPFHIQERMLHLCPDRRFALLLQRLIASPAPVAADGQASSPPATPSPTPDSPPACQLPDNPHRPTPASLLRGVTGALPSRRARSPES